MRLLKNALLVLISLAVSVVVAEGAVRWLDGYPILRTPLGEAMGLASVKQESVDKVPRAAGVERGWFFDDPPPLPNRRAIPQDWERLYRFVEANPVGGMSFRPSDAFKVWNTDFSGDPCRHWFLRHAPGQLFLYDAPDGQPRPPYRFLPDVTIPSGLTTNQIGWRGPPIDNPRPEKTVRIVFVGSSTVVEAHHLPYSWPEYVGHWMNVWSRAKGLGIRFEVLNAGRESIISSDIAAVVRTEVLPLRPDLVVYHEGGNQFRPASIVEKVPDVPVTRPSTAQEPGAVKWLKQAARYSALIGRVQAAFAMAGATAGNSSGAEWPKPDYKVIWPEGLDEMNPDLDFANLPVNLNAIQKDLDRIRGDLGSIGADMAITSFFWMVKDGMVVDPVRHRFIIEQLNAANWPYRYRDLERLAKFQNRLLARYAATHGLAFLDLVGNTPFDPDLFVDAVHTSYAGTRIRGWAAFNLLVPLVEKKLADKAWPRPWPAGAPTALPTFSPRLTKLECKAP